MTHARDQHHLVYHYADGVADILGLSTAQQLCIRTAMHLALREQAAGYEATAADAATRIHLLANELDLAQQRIEQALAEQLSRELAKVKTSPAPAVISTNGTHAVELTTQLAAQNELPPHHVDQHLINFAAEAAQEAAATDPQPDPTPAAATDRKPFNFRWPTLDDKSLDIVRQLDEGKIAWRTLEREDKRIIVLATIAELQMDLPPGQTLGLLEFDRRRPIWMSGFSSITQSLGRTWTQMWSAATKL